MPFAAMLDRLIDNIRDYGLETVFSRYYSCYRGVVHDNIDPEKEGKIQVVVPMISGNDPLGGWCYPKAAVGGAQFGIYHPPDIGSGVWVEFENGQLDAPLYSGGWWATLEEGGLELPSDLQQQADGDPPTAFGWYTSTGHHIFFETKAGIEQVRLGWKNGDSKQSFVSIDKDGSIQIRNHTGTYISLDAVEGGMTYRDSHGNVISATDANVQMVHAKGALVEVKDGVATVMAKQVVISGEALNVATGGCTLGDGATEPLVLGNKLLALWTQAMAIFASHLHPTPTGPSGPPSSGPWPTYAADTNSLNNKGI